MQPADSADPLRQAGSGNPTTSLVLHFHVVMILSPVVADEQHLAQPLPRISPVVFGSVEKNLAT
jgi:hypothetical protein